MKEIKILIVFILTLLMLTSCTGQNIYPSISTSDSQIIDEANDENNPYYDIIKSDIDWMKLTRREKLEKANQIVEIEKQNLGIADNILIITSHNTDSFYSTRYNNGYVIYINPEYLDTKSSTECIQIICQETYRFYQLELIKQYLNADEKSRTLVCYDKARVYLREMFKATDEPSKKSVGQFDREQYYKQRYEMLYLRFLCHNRGDGLMSDRV